MRGAGSSNPGTACVRAWTSTACAAGCAAPAGPTPSRTGTGCPRRARWPHADGSLPDFLGRYENLEADWSTLCERLDLPAQPLPRLNTGAYHAMPAVPVDGHLLGLLRRRYAGDYGLGNYGEAPPVWPW